MNNLLESNVTLYLYGVRKLKLFIVYRIATKSEDTDHTPYDRQQSVIAHPKKMGCKYFK